MRTILHIIRKEFTQIRRNKLMLPIIVVLPIVQLLILANAATFTIKNSDVIIVDEDRSPYSRQLTQQITASPYFNLVAVVDDADQADAAILKGDADAMLHFPANWQQVLIKENHAPLYLGLDAINGSAAGVMQGYLLSIIQDFNQQVRSEWLPRAQQPVGATPLTIDTRYWYNPEQQYSHFMVPGILVLLVTMVTMFLSALNVAREKELGTIEQLNVTPIKKHHFIIGKLLPFWLIGLGELALGIIIGKLVFAIPMEGSLAIVFVFAMVYMVAVLSIGLLISTLADTQQQAMFITWFFLVIFILMSGLFTPIDSMPDWAQWLTYANPIRYFVEVMRAVLMKGAVWSQVQPAFVIICGYALLMLSLAVWRYQKRV